MVAYVSFNCMMCGGLHIVGAYKKQLESYVNLF